MGEAIAGSDATAEAAGVAAAFRFAGKALFSLGLVKGSEGNLSTCRDGALLVTRTGARLDDLREGDVLAGTLEEPPHGASSDLPVHVVIYADRGPGAVAHAHPPGAPVVGDGGPGRHGAYAFGDTLEAAVEELVRRVRER